MLASLPSQEKKITLEKIKKYLEEHNAGYILLTCSKPSQEGYMEIELAFDGEDALLQYLLEQAKEKIEGAQVEDFSTCSP